MFHRRALAVLTGVAVVLAACGGGDAAPSNVTRADAPATTVAPPASRPSITVAPTTTVAPEASATTALALDPDELARRVVAAELAGRAGGSDDVVPQAFALQVLYRQLAATPNWEAPVLAAVPESLRLAVRENVAARREFRAMHTTLSDTLPAWRIVDPVPAEELLGYYREGEATFGVPWEILAAVNLVETGLGRIRGTSTAGAQGPMQFLPATWAAFGDGGDIDDTHDAIMGAARYLAHNGGGRGDVAGALWNYNHSDRYVAGVQHYAAVLADDPAAFTNYYHWQIVYLSTVGDVWLPTGYETTAKIPVGDYVTAHPDRLLD